MPEPRLRTTPVGHPVSLRGWVLPSLAGYQGRWASRDIVAGLVLSALLVPQGMAYAELAGMPPVTGFYAALLALVAYALVGSSRHLGVGPEPGTAILAATGVGAIAAGDPARYLALMAALALTVGVICVLAAVARGEIDLNRIAREELANRGLGIQGEWVGFQAARKIHGLDN